MKSPFSKEIYIRLNDDEAGFTCTRYQWFLRKVTAFSLHNESQPADADIAFPRPLQRPPSVLGLTDES